MRLTPVYPKDVGCKHSPKCIYCPLEQCIEEVHKKNLKKVQKE